MNERDRQIAALWNEPRTIGAVAKALGLSRGAVGGALHRMRKRGVALRTGNLPTQVQLNEGTKMADIRVSKLPFSQGPGAPAYQMVADQENVAVVPIDGGDMTHRIPLPLGTTHLHIQRRHAGDFRAELKCRDKFVNAAAPDLAEAIAAAVCKVAA